VVAVWVKKIRPHGLQSQPGFYLRRSLEALCRAPKIPINANSWHRYFHSVSGGCEPFARCGWADLAF
jgi:hypothetical protein